MEKLTQREQLILQKIKSFLGEGHKITVRALQAALGYASPRSVSVLLEQITTKGWIYRDMRGDIQLSPTPISSDTLSVRSIPLVGAIACGMPIFAEENIETHIPISTKIAPAAKTYFFLRAEGDSMNQKGIENGDLVLIEQTQAVKTGDIVVALINDEATLKELRIEHGIVYLIPHSDNPRHKPIILAEGENLLIQGKFIQCFPGSLFS